MALPNVSYYGYSPSYAGLPVEEFKDYKETLAKEYDVTREAADKIDAALSTINPAFDEDRKYIDNVKTNLKSSIANIAKDMQGGTRYETARNQIRELASKINNDGLINKIKENTERKKQLDKVADELNSKGFNPLRFGQPKNFSSIDANGKFVDYSEEIQPMGDWASQKQKIVDRVKPTLSPYFNTTEFKDYIKTGVISEFGRKEIERAKQHLIRTYAGTLEGQQEFRDLTKNKGMLEEDAYKQMSDDIFSAGMIGEYKVDNFSVMAKKENSFDEYVKRKDYDKSLETPKAGKEQLGAKDGTSYQTSTKTLGAIKGEKQFGEVDDSKFKNGKLIDEYEDVTTVATGAFGPGVQATETRRKVKTTKERKILDEFKQFAKANGLPEMNDAQINKFIKTAGKEILGRKVIEVEPDTLKGLYDGGRLLTKENIALSLPDEARIIGSGGNIVPLKEFIAKQTDIVGVNFDGFSAMADPANKEKPGDMVYTVTTKSGEAFRIITKMERFDDELAPKLQKYDVLLEPIRSGKIATKANLSGGQIWDVYKKDGKEMTDFIPFSTMTGNPAHDAVKMLPVLGYDKKEGKMNYKLQPYFKHSDGKTYSFTETDINNLYNNKQITPEEKDFLDDVMIDFKQKSNGFPSIGYNDIIYSMRQEINNHPNLVYLKESTKSKGNINAQNAKYNEQTNNNN